MDETFATIRSAEDDGLYILSLTSTTAYVYAFVCEGMSPILAIIYRVCVQIKRTTGNWIKWIKVNLNNAIS